MWRNFDLRTLLIGIFSCTLLPPSSARPNRHPQIVVGFTHFGRTVLDVRTYVVYLYTFIILKNILYDRTNLRWQKGVGSIIIFFTVGKTTCTSTRAYLGPSWYLIRCGTITTCIMLCTHDAQNIYILTISIMDFVANRTFEAIRYYILILYCAYKKCVWFTADYNNILFIIVLYIYATLGWVLGENIFERQCLI